MKRLILFCLLFASNLYASDLYPVNNPADWSPGAISSWAKLYFQPKIASSVYDPEWGGSLPPIASSSFGDLFILDDPNNPATTTVLYRSTLQNGTPVWAPLSSQGTTDHTELDNLDYANSGHTGFAASTDIPNVGSFSHDLLDGAAASSIHDTHNNGLYIPLASAPFAHDDLTGLLVATGHDTHNDARYVQLHYRSDIASDVYMLSGSYLVVQGNLWMEDAQSVKANRISLNYNGVNNMGLPFDEISSGSYFDIGGWYFGGGMTWYGKQYYNETYPELSSGTMVMQPALHYVFEQYSETPWLGRTYNAAITASGAFYLRPLEAAPDDTWIDFFPAGTFYIASPSCDIIINNGSSWVTVPKTGGLFQGTHNASDTTPGVTADVVIGTVTLHFKDGLFVGSD